MNILIPSYEPDEKLIKLIKQLKESCKHPIIIVDDGSGSNFSHLFAQASELGCDVLSYNENKGKGYALKKGFNHIAQNYSSAGIVTADADGQHAIEDILRTGSEIKSKTVVLGGRRFDTKEVPLRSKLGNSFSRFIFALLTGVKVHDTQTGLRGFHVDEVPWLTSLDGDRFEYEMNMLLSAQNEGIELKEITIETIYLNENETSHFDTVNDSKLIMKQVFKASAPFLKYVSVAIISFVIDFMLLTILISDPTLLFIPILISRLISGNFNYFANRYFVFKAQDEVPFAKSYFRYFLLAITIIIANWIGLKLLTTVLFLPLLFSKIVIEFILFVTNFIVQRVIIFSKNKY